jgi:hypothetical protein
MQNLHRLAIGQSVTVTQMGIAFTIDGRPHVLQMGPSSVGACVTRGPTLVHGTGTTSATVRRTSRTRWVTELPARGIGRLFDITNTMEKPVERGLYYVRIRYEHDAVPLAYQVLVPVADSQGGAAVVARYRAMKRDSANT